MPDSSSICGCVPHESVGQEGTCTPGDFSTEILHQLEQQDPSYNLHCDQYSEKHKQVSQGFGALKKQQSSQTSLCEAHDLQEKGRREEKGRRRERPRLPCKSSRTAYERRSHVQRFRSRDTWAFELENGSPALGDRIANKCVLLQHCCIAGLQNQLGTAQLSLNSALSRA